jgi:cysteine-rich repeat protein
MRNESVHLLVLMAGLVSMAPLPYTAPEGDLNLDGEVSVTDVQCTVLLFGALAEIAGMEGDQCTGTVDCQGGFWDRYCRQGFTADHVCLPSCLGPTVVLGPDPNSICLDPAAETSECKGLTRKKSADMNCDGEIGNVDLNIMVSVVMLKSGGPNTSDVDSDGRLNFCDDDSDGDGDPDIGDCHPLDPGLFHGQIELCNGLDDDCNGEVDEHPELLCGDDNTCTTHACDPVSGCETTMLPDCCGNGIQEAGEQCDDGNQVGDDQCESDCTNPPGSCYDDWKVGTLCNGTDLGGGCTSAETGFHWKGMYDGYACWWATKNQAWMTTLLNPYHLANFFGLDPDTGQISWCHSFWYDPNPPMGGCHEFCDIDEYGMWGWCVGAPFASGGWICFEGSGKSPCN